MKKKIEIAVLIIYTYINLRVMWPIISEGGYVFMTNGAFSGAITVLLGLFLNAALIIYWLHQEGRTNF